MKFSCNYKESSAILMQATVSMILLRGFEHTASVVDTLKDVPALKRRVRVDNITTRMEKEGQGESKRNFSFFSEQVDGCSNREE
jgi:hypothetical protein